MSTTAPHSPEDLDALEPGTSVRFRTATGPGIALKNSDRTWSAPGTGEKLTSAQLWETASSLIILGARPSWAGDYRIGA